MQNETDEFSFGLLEPKADGFRNYVTRKTNGHGKSSISAEEMFIDKKAGNEATNCS